MSDGSRGLPRFQSYGSYNARFASDMANLDLSHTCLGLVFSPECGLRFLTPARQQAHKVSASQMMWAGGPPGHVYGARGGGLILYVISPYKFLLSQLILHWNVPLSTVHYIYIQFKARDSSSTPVGRSVSTQLSTRMSVHACARGFGPPMSHALAPRAARAPDPRGTPMAQRRCPSAALILSHAVDF